VYNPGKPRFQLRKGEEAISVFDAEKATPADILPSFRSGSLISTHAISTIESFGLVVLHTPGDPKLPQLLQDNHMDIRPVDGMNRDQFKAALKALENSIGVIP
jgi:hypothetical protein